MIEKFSLNAEKSREFMKFFYAEQKTNKFEMLEGSGSAHWNSDNYFEVYHDINFEYKGYEVFISWKVLYNNHGELLTIECLNDDEETRTQIAKEIIHTCLQHVINGTRKVYFKRSLFLSVSGCNLAGEYWFNGFRFAPLFPDDKSRIANAERIIVVDQDVTAIDNEHANELAVENAENYASLLSLIMDTELEQPMRIEKYVMENDGSMKRMYTQIHDSSGITSMPRKGEICPTRRFEGSVYDRIKYVNQYLVLPIESRKIINGILNEEVKFRDAVFKACKLYRIGRNSSRTYPTVTLSYECAAVESIVKNMKYDSFTGFMTKYVGPNRELYDFIYSNVRSGHFHAGEFPFLDFSSSSLSLDNSAVFTLRRIEEYAHNLMREAILRWIDERIEFSTLRLNVT